MIGAGNCALAVVSCFRENHGPWHGEFARDLPCFAEVNNGFALARCVASDLQHVTLCSAVCWIVKWIAVGSMNGCLQKHRFGLQNRDIAL